MMVLNRIKCFIKKIRFKRNGTIGNNLNVGALSNCISNKKCNITIGDNCEINGVIFSYGNGKISIGNNCFINTSTFIGAMESVTIGNHVIFASNVRVFDNNNHPTEPEKRLKMCESGFHNELWEWKYAQHKPIVIEDNVWIGEFSAILKGVTIGQGSIVASHSIVVKDVPPYSIVAGNPAKVVKSLKG